MMAVAHEYLAPRISNTNERIGDRLYTGSDWKNNYTFFKTLVDKCQVICLNPVSLLYSNDGQKCNIVYSSVHYANFSNKL